MHRCKHRRQQFRNSQFLVFMFPKFVLLHIRFFENHIALITFDTIVSIKFVSSKWLFVTESFLTLIALANAQNNSRNKQLVLWFKVFIMHRWKQIKILQGLRVAQAAVTERWPWKDEKSLENQFFFLGGKKREDWTMVITMAKLRMAHASRLGHKERKRERKQWPASHPQKPTGSTVGDHNFF